MASRNRRLIVAVIFILAATAEIDNSRVAEAGETKETKTTVKLHQFKAAYPITDAERELIEKVLAAESRGETLAAQMAMCQVMRDRHILWNIPIAEILLAENQFAPPYNGEIPPSIKTAVTRIFDYGETVFDGPTTHFCTNNPYWVSGKVYRGSVGRTKFYY